MKALRKPLARILSTLQSCQYSVTRAAAAALYPIDCWRFTAQLDRCSDAQHGLLVAIKHAALHGIAVAQIDLHTSVVRVRRQVHVCVSQRLCCLRASTNTPFFPMF